MIFGSLHRRRHLRGGAGGEHGKRVGRGLVESHKKDATSSDAGNRHETLLCNLIMRAESAVGVDIQA